MALFVEILYMTSTFTDHYFLYRHPAWRKSGDQISEHDSQINSAAPSSKTALMLKLEQHFDAELGSRATILVDNTLFAGTNKFRWDKMRMHEAVKMSKGSDLSQGPFKFRCIEV